MSVETEVLLDLVGEAYAVLDLESFAPRVLDAARAAVPAEWASLNALGPEPNVVSIAVPPVPLHFYDVYAKHAHEHPIVKHMQRTGDGGPTRISDVVDRADVPPAGAVPRAVRGRWGSSTRSRSRCPRRRATCSRSC